MTDYQKEEIQGALLGAFAASFLFIFSGFLFSIFVTVVGACLGFAVGEYVAVKRKKDIKVVS